MGKKEGIVNRGIPLISTEKHGYHPLLVCIACVITHEIQLSHLASLIMLEIPLPILH